MTSPGKKRKRRSELRHKQNRRKKVRKLKKAYQAATTEGKRTEIIAKLLKMAPQYPVHEFQSAVHQRGPATPGRQKASKEVVPAIKEEANP